MLKVRRLLCVVLLAGASFISYPATASDTTFFAILDGGNEVSPGGQANAGDRNGYGSASVVFLSDGQLCFSIISMLLNQLPTAAHIHRAPAGVNGPIVVTLAPPNDATAGTSRGCRTIAPALGSEIRQNPRRFYINVHTPPFPNGAIRGQLF